MISALGQNDCYIRYISAIWEGPLCVTAELIEMVQYIHLLSVKFTGMSQCIARKAKNLEGVLVTVPEIANYVRILFFDISDYNTTQVHIKALPAPLPILNGQ